MQRIKIADESASPNFIGAWNYQSEVYEQLIQYFEHNTINQFPGTSSGQVMANQKLSTDITIHPANLLEQENVALREYIKILATCYQDYAQSWPFLKGLGQLDIGAFNIQKYSAGGHFSQLHCERSSRRTSQRVFAWMTYLNNVECGGDTEFFHYDIRVTPRTGTTLIWPAEWTHAHRGDFVTKGEKYIITGWMEFP
jgi:prolyl 4-hydroxylase